MSWWAQEYIDAGRHTELLSWVFWVLLSITLHELGHGWAAMWQGDKTPIYSGHMTANPIVHMGVHSLIMFALCGLAWGAMPVDPSRFRSRYGDLYVSAAGPAMNLALGTVCTILLIGWLRLVPDGPVLAHGAVFLYVGATLNLILMLINLLPIPPLDGSHMLASLNRTYARWVSDPQAAMIGTVVFLAIFFVTPIGGILTGILRMLIVLGVELAGAALGSPPLFEAMDSHRDLPIW